MRWLKKTGLALIALTALLCLIIVWVTWRSLPDMDGRIALNGPAAAIDITRDSHGVPHIKAASEGDAFFALGYVHAQDRLFQMDFMRRLGAGRLAEVLGRQGLGSDKFMRTLGLYHHAQANFAVLDAETKMVLERYADGVNAWLDNRDAPLPPEFQLLQYEPEAWAPADSLVWQKLMSLSLAGNWREELLRAQLLQVLPADRVAELWPEPDLGSTTTVSSTQLQIPKHITQALIKAIDDFAPPTLASNVWAVDGQHTASGKPLLASDPHLGFQAPNVWYLARLDWPGGQRVGATSPGVPLFVIGHNGSVAWGVTTTHADLQDLFVEQLVDNGQYMSPDGPLPFDLRQETIDVRFNDPVPLAVRISRHGPVVSDLANIEMAGQKPNTALALAATMLRDDDRTASGIDRLGRSKSVEDIRKALKLFEGPQQNFVYADIHGGIGYTAPAKVPVRKAGNGTVPVPGDSGAYDWQGWVPYNELPQSLEPASGRLVNANNRPIPIDYPHLIAASFPEGYRADRINERLDDLTGTEATVANMMDIQQDSQSSMALDILPLLLSRAAPQTRLGQRAVELLSKWDGEMDRDRPEPLIFLTWMEETKRALLEDDLGPLYQNFRGGRIRLIKSILNGNLSWCDDISSQAMESCNGAVSMALDNALSWLENRPELKGTDFTSWRWGQFHKATFSHPLFGFIPGLSSLTSVEIETDGADHTVNRGGFRSVRGPAPFRHGHGAGLRAIFDLNDLERSQFVIAVGQSGHPASVNYDDLTPIWRDGGMLSLASRGATENSTGVLQTLSLVPLPKTP